MILKRTLVCIVLLCTSITVMAIDDDKNTKLYGIGQVSLISNYALSEGVLDSNNVYTLTNLDAKCSFGFGFFYNMGYFVIPKRLSLGLGLGAVLFNNPSYNTFPIYGDLRFYFTDERNIPYLVLDYGGSIKIGEKFRQGAFFRLGLGYKMCFGDNVCLVMDISYAPTSLSLTEENYIYSDHTLQMKGVGFTVGLILF